MTDIFRTRRNSILNKIAINANITGNSRKTAWLYKVASKGFFSFPKEEAMNFANQIDMMISELNAVYGENWDFILSQEGIAKKYKLYCCIRFPEITISNTYGKSHVIEELFVIFDLPKIHGENGYLYPTNLRGFRMKTSNVEFISDYSHSHLPGKSFAEVSGGAYKVYPGSFCTGNDTEIQQTMENLIGGFSREMFTMFLFTIDSMVRWESIEGVPHRRISTISETANLSYFCLELNSSKSTATTLVDTIQIYDINVPLSLSTRTYSVKNDQFEKVLFNCIKDYHPHLATQIIISKRDTTLYNPNPIPTSTSPIRCVSSTLYFRDVRMEAQIGNTAETETETLIELSSEIHEVHPTIINYAKTEIEKRINAGILREKIRSSSRAYLV